MGFEGLEDPNFINHFEGKYFGTYNGFVKNSNDPERRGRVRLNIPSIFGDDETLTEWAEHSCISAGTDSGSMITSEESENSIALIQFANGDLQNPIVTGYIHGGDAKNPDTPKESLFFCDGTKCIDCSDRDADHLTTKEHKEFHNHKDQFYCPKKKVLYKSPKGATISISEVGTEEYIEIVDQGGQMIRLSSPIKKDKVRKRGISNAKDNTQFDPQNDIQEEGASIELIDLANQFLKFSSKYGEEKIDIKAIKDFILTAINGKINTDKLSLNTEKISFFTDNPVSRDIVDGNGSYNNISGGNDGINLADLNEKVALIHNKLEELQQALRSYYLI